MKRVLILMIVFFLTFSLNGFSQFNAYETASKPKTEKPRKMNVKTGRQPRKSVSKKKVHSPAPKKHKQTKGSKVNT